jgi:hypothetical protein
MNINKELGQIKYLFEYKRGQEINKLFFSNLPRVQPDRNGL